MAMGLPPPSARRCISVVNPPRLRPKASESCAVPAAVASSASKGPLFEHPQRADGLEPHSRRREWSSQSASSASASQPGVGVPGAAPAPTRPPSPSGRSAWPRSATERTRAQGRAKALCGSIYPKYGVDDGANGPCSGVRFLVCGVAAADESAPIARRSRCLVPYPESNNL